MKSLTRNKFQAFSEIVRWSFVHHALIDLLCCINIVTNNHSHLYTIDPQNTVETILGLNQEFYKELLEAKRVKKHLADVLLWFLPYLKLYITFIGQYEDATKMIKSLSNTNVQFRNLLTKSLEDPRSLEGVTEKSQPLGLTDLMPKPLQRMFAYNNMLQRMAEILPREARVYSSVVHVKTEMEKHIMWVNETKRKFENFPKTPTDPSKKKGTFFGVPSQKPKNSI